MHKAHDALAPCLDFEHVFSIEALMEAERKCRRGVMWKDSAIDFDRRRGPACAKLVQELSDGAYHKRPPKHFCISERGKLRHISAVVFRDRVVQRALCDRSLLPVLSYSLIYDNAASLPGKGISFARRRFEERLLAACRRCDSPWIAVIDFSSYFDSIDSHRAFEMLREHYTSLALTEAERASIERILAVAKLFICDERGLGLGNQTSQAIAVWYLNTFDHEA